MTSVGVWAVGEIALRLRTRGGNSNFEWSLVAVVFGIEAGVGLAFVAVYSHSTAIAAGWAPVILGDALFIAGLALRLWAVVTLGRFFKVTVSIQEHHRVIRSGPYRVLRHPSYTGLLLLLAGLGLALGTWLGLLAIIILPTIGLLIRIRVEESALLGALGEEYATYAAETRRLLPGVW